MNIEFTEEEYGKVLELLFMAEWLLTAHKEVDRRTEPFVQLIQKFYEQAAKSVYKDMLTFDQDLKKYLPAKPLEHSSEARRLLDEFTDETFWHELTYRFTERDLARSAGGYEKLHMLSPEDRFEAEIPIEEKYLDEFEQHGIERLEIVEQFTPLPTGPRTSD